MLRAFDDAYYPSLMIRPAEMEALNELPEKNKNSIFPIIKFCPWTTAKKLSSAIDKLELVYGARPLICDLDYDYSSNSDREAVTDFLEMRNPANRAEKWVEFIKNNANLIPTVLCKNMSASDIKYQLGEFISLERGFAFRFEVNHLEQYNFTEIKSILDEKLLEITTGDFCIIIDAGLVQDVNLTELKVVSAVNHFKDYVKLRVILSSASFPNSFQQYTGIGAIDILSRRLFEKVKSKFNMVELSYSDWGSTKPRSNQQGGGVPIDRIDFPLPNSWIVARNKNKGWTYKDAAQNLIDSEFWKNAPNIWGTQRIVDTAEGRSMAISNPRHNTSSRINIHLFVQNHFGSDAGSITTDEPWED